ncbi:hypothetical protein [Riemerella anatipestifer]|uniref:Uncharacterized protein n=2 Tax=Riemerella anatipestifer TaxID=34085 RepID=J9R9K3_RIEAN|nr:hypothetical protein [Riemerella anatipestifer]AFR36382.1 hypothetical protein B739_1798 [Riemerella anatipestifer RA-CH-1]AIH03342.1 hypothetical protein M949_2176 [Riemerella anatipestifer CH3]AQY22859.1 hypothetical protein AB406_1918 [Riemerella anatipestifer]AZZ57798.1 hypothetical protein AWB57_01350 [Riemerella anatipestifer]MBT0572113.1 hypothetical protein [Riemerella anatipestifer]
MKQVEIKNEVEYIDGVREALSYILEVIDKDTDYLYHEKEIIKKIIHSEIWKNISEKEFNHFLNQLQQQKNK